MQLWQVAGTQRKSEEWEHRILDWPEACMEQPHGTKLEPWKRKPDKIFHVYQAAQPVTRNVFVWLTAFIPI